MRHSNRLKERIENDAVALGAGVATFSPTVIEVYGQVGFDFAWLDFEHTGPSPYDAGVFEELTRAAEVADIDLLVRLPSGDPPLVRKVLDAGVRTLLIPRVETAREVREAVAASQFEYDGAPGDRGVGIGRTTTWGNSADDQPEVEDDSVMVGAMIENETAVANLDEILSVPELDFVFIGPADLSVSLGVPWQWDAPVVHDHVEEIVEKATDAGVPVGGVKTDADSAVEAIEDDYQLLYVGGELGAAQAALEDRLRTVEDERPE